MPPPHPTTPTRLDTEQPPDDDARGPARWLTISGRLLLTATLVGFGGAFAAFLLWAMENLPSGRYPLFVLVFPLLVAAAAFFFAAAFLLERVGVRVYRRKTDGT